MSDRRFAEVPAAQPEYAEPAVGARQVFQAALATMLLLVFVGALVASFFFNDSTLRTTMCTGALSLITMAVGYYFGSSHGSQRKDQIRSQQGQQQ